jgi:DNA primase
MPKSSFVDFKAVKAAITMEQVLAHYGLMETLKRSGESLSGPCPIHKGTNPTQFRVSTTKNVWNCFSECKHGGNALDFIAEMEKTSIHAAAIKAVEWFKLDLPKGEASEEETSEPEAKPRKEPPAAEKVAPNTPLKFRLDKLERSHPYLAEREITQETAIDFGVGFCAKGMMADRIAIPIHNEGGEVVAYAGRFPGEPPEGTPKYKLPQGFRKSQELFNLDRAKNESGPLVIVEGFFGCMRFHQAGVRRVVALMGSTLSAAQEVLVRRHVGEKEMVIVALDEDDAGKAGREDIAVRLSRHCFVRVHAFGEEGKQPEDLTPEEALQIVGGVR